ncbi:MAG: hypothetical protein EOP06_02095 [Proteobacteria bacterium]|nr:MAG: hypothetical protein EOP06_02095 [Pseudomonadota bacterium]
MQNLNVAFILSSVFVSVLVGFSTAHACEVLETKMTLTDIYVSQNSGKSVLRPQNANSDFEGLTVGNCKGGYVQLAHGVMLPHPQVYAGMMFRSPDIAHAPACAIGDGTSSQTDLSFRSQITNQVEISRECIGLDVKDISGQKLQLLNNGQCKIVSQNENGSQILLKGENCVLEPGSAGFQVVSALLPSCQAILPNAKVKEIDMTLSVQYAQNLDAQTSPDGLASKPVRLTISSDKSPVETLALSKRSLKTFPVAVSNEYRLKFDLTKLTLQGTTETGLVADAQYFIDRSDSSLASQYRAPFVLKNEMYLVKKGEASQFLGGWYNASIVPAGWSGQDGAASFNRLIDTPAPGKLNSISKLMKTGDRVVLVSRLENPNAGTIKYGRYLQVLLAKEKGMKPQISNVVTNVKANSVAQLPTLDGLDGIKQLDVLKVLAPLGEEATRKAKDLTDWPVRFQTVCINDHCAKVDRLSGGFEIQSVFAVESADFDVQIKLQEQLVKWNGQPEAKKSKEILNQVNCQ